MAFQVMAMCTDSFLYTEMAHIKKREKIILNPE